MNSSEPLTVAFRLSLSLDGLCRAVAARIAPGLAGWAMQAAMIVVVWTRIRRTEGKIQALLARFLAGKLRVPSGTPRVGRARTEGPPTAKLQRAPATKLPRRFAWLCQMVPYEAAGFASQLRVVLAEPEMVGLLEASAQARRVLAPLFRMLGIEASLLRAPLPAPRTQIPVAVAGEVSPEAAGRDEGIQPCNGIEPCEGIEPPAPPDPVQRVSPDRARWGGD